MKEKMSITQKISLAAMLLAISFVLTIVAKTVNMGNFFFVRFSFSPGIVVASSLILGPFFGALIGALTDLLPALVYPTGTLNIFITLVYLILGIAPYFIHKVTKNLSKRGLIVVSIALGIIVEIGLAIFFYGTNVLDNTFGDAASWGKVTILIAAFLLLLGIAILPSILMKKERSFLPASISVGETTFICSICEIIIMVILKSLAFYVFYEFLATGENPFSFSFLLSMLLVAAIPEVVIMIFVVSLVIWIDERVIKKSISS